MFDPKNVFDDPLKYWPFITCSNDDEFEGQLFDRKEISAREKTTSSQVQKTISAFANSNKEGGLLVLGVASNGTIKGTKAFSEKLINSITNLNNLLKSHLASTRVFRCKNVNGDDDEIILIYSNYVESAICQSHDDNPKSWIRSGPQSLQITREQEEILRRQKGIKRFEITPSSEYVFEEVDIDVFKQFLGRDTVSEESVRDRLYQVGAICKQNGQYYFTNAGLLFFVSNPQRVLRYAHIRLAKFQTSIKDYENRGLPVFEKVFDGPLSIQLLKVRAYFQESGFFKMYRYRKIGGGFIEEPELPINAVDEGIVNAVAHRDYGISLPIECILYDDAFYIESPGRINQKDKSVPQKFTLDETFLVSTPNNSHIVDWLKEMKDDKGSSFVQKWGEGTKTIRSSMADLSLPSPLYRTSMKNTSLTLFNNAIEREAKIRQSNSLFSTNTSEFINCFKVHISDLSEEENVEYKNFDAEYNKLTYGLRNKLESTGWFIDKYGHSRIKAHRKNHRIKTNDRIVDKSVMVFPSYFFQFREYYKELYIVCDYGVEIKNIVKLSELSLKIDRLIDRQVDYKLEGEWRKGKIVDSIDGSVIITDNDINSNFTVINEDVIPTLRKEEINNFLGSKGSILERLVKKESLLIARNSTRERLAKVLSNIQRIKSELFPLRIDDFFLDISLKPESISQESVFNLARVNEPKVEFGNNNEETDIRTGITKFGAFDSSHKSINIVPICISGFEENMKALLHRLQIGKYKYRGVERTFNSKFTYDVIYNARNEEEIFSECKRLVKQHSEWAGNKNIDRIFLVHIPDTSISRGSFNSPYFKVKKYLLENGIPCQMVSNSTLQNPDWKDLNLSLNIVSKCGITPWVLPNKIPEADFFIGFSYSQEKNYRKGGRRLVGYANVFNSYGKWEFFSGSNTHFNYSERKQYFGELTNGILRKLDSDLPESPTIHFHYSSKFSKDDRMKILDAARNIRPNGTYVFTSINFSHMLKMYDAKPETDGSIGRGGFIRMKDNQLLLSTTGFNPYGKTLGTPRPLEATVWHYDKNSRSSIDLRSVAVQLLSLTKLNWASTASVSSEPITTKYASNIAYLTTAFLSSDQEFVLHPVLESTPWFI